MNSFKKALMLLLISAAWMQAMDKDQKKAQEQKPSLSMADRALLAAASFGSESAAGIALRWGARINAQDGNGHTALHKAVIKAYQSDPTRVQQFHEKPGLVQLLMQSGADCTIENSQGVSPLDAIATQGDSVSLRIAPYILRAMHHCKTMAHDPQKSLGKITYHAAYGTLHCPKECLKECYALLRDSLRAGSDMTCRICPTKGTIYGIAADFGDKSMKEVIATFQKEHSERVKLVLHSGNPHQPLLHASLYPIIFECLYARPQQGVMTGYCKDLLTMQIRTEQEANDVFEKFKRFKSVYGDIWNARDTQGNTALHLAVMQGNMAIVQWMDTIPRSADDTIYLYQRARQYGRSDIAELYLNHIAEELSRAIRTGDDAYVLKLANAHMLMDMNVSMKPIIKQVGIALNPEYNQQASYNKRFEIFKIMCAAGVDIHRINLDSTSETYLEFAIGYMVPDAIKLLLYLGADYARPNSKTKETPWEQTDDPEIKALLKNPKETLENLTDAEKKEFADIKAEREKRLAAYKAARMHGAAAAAGAGNGDSH